jgi:deoxyribodipyrimidine photo-lyase
MRKMHQTPLWAADPHDAVGCAAARPQPIHVSPTPPTLAQALARIESVRPDAYARTRNAINGAVSGLSPYITHGFVSLADVLRTVNDRYPLEVGHKWVYELGWRAFFRHVWQHRGDAIFQSLHVGPLPDSAYLDELPCDIRHAATGVPVIDQAVRTLYAHGTLHNHARMWLASYVVHVRKVHWRVGADWLYGHLLDGDLASNHLSWQWVAGTGSSKPYVFNAENVARFATRDWHSPDSVIDAPYELLDQIARQSTAPGGPAPASTATVDEPAVQGTPPASLGTTAPDARAIQGRDIWLIHPWNLGPLPAQLPEGVIVLGLYVSDFHCQWPWTERRWNFVGQRMAELADTCWFGSADDLGAALEAARHVRAVAEPHLAHCLSRWAEPAPGSELFPTVERPCHSFSKWWSQATRGMTSARDLLERQ